MDITRKEFCGAFAAGTVWILLEGCGGGGGDSSAPAQAPASVGSCGASGADISGNHGHALSMAKADLDSAVDLTFNIQAGADHNHTVTLTVAQLRSLKAGTTVVVTSSTTLGHAHSVSASCL